MRLFEESLGRLQTDHVDLLHVHDLQDEADLVVVGARGRTGLAHLVLGSTASSLVHRPSCPIVVVPHP